MKWKTAWLLTLSWAFGLSTGVAQLTTGTISGVVTDQTGALIPGARITARNTTTGIARTTVTGPTGSL